MIVVSKDKIPDLIRYGFRRHTQSKNLLHKCLFYKGKYIGDMWFDLTEDRKYYEPKLNNVRLNHISNTLYFLFKDGILEYR